MELYINGHFRNLYKLEVPTMYKAYFSGLNFRNIPTKYGQKYDQKNGTIPTYLHFRTLEFPLNNTNHELKTILTKLDHY